MYWICSIDPRDSSRPKSHVITTPTRTRRRMLSVRKQRWFWGQDWRTSMSSIILFLKGSISNMTNVDNFLPMIIERMFLFTQIMTNWPMAIPQRMPVANFQKLVEEFEIVAVNIWGGNIYREGPVVIQTTMEAFRHQM